MNQRTQSYALFTILALGATSSSALAQLEDFEGGSNEGAWEFQNEGGPALNNSIITTGGNPGAYLDSGSMPETTFYPRAATTAPSTVFHGDYRARGVTGIRCDVKVDDNTFSISLAMTLRLINDNGTPLDTSDDCHVWKFYSGAPSAGSGWASHTFDIDSAAVLAPSGWQTGSIPNCPGDVDSIWNAVIANVTGVEIWFGSPNTLVLGLAQTLDVSVDNISIGATAVYEDFCFGDGGGAMGCTPCPCGNDSPAGAGGCLNSAGSSALLMASGSPMVGNDTLRFEVSGANPSTFGILVSADNQLPTMGTCPPGSGIQSPVLDGLRCVGGGLLRHGTRASDPGGDIGLTNNGWGPRNGPMGGLIANGGFTTGQTRQFQCFYREDMAAGCLNGQNTTQGVSVTFL